MFAKDIIFRDAISEQELSHEADLGSDSDSDSDSDTDLSKAMDAHKSFKTFGARALDLCQVVLTPLGGELVIESIHEGNFNIIITVSSTRDEPLAANQYICRVSKPGTKRLDYDLAPLQLLGHREKLKVPFVVSSDLTTKNVIRSPYIIQKRIPGSPLLLRYRDLPHQMKCAVAKELGEIFAELHSIQSISSGRLALLHSQSSVRVEPFNSTEIGDSEPYVDGPAVETPANMLQALLQDQKESLLLYTRNESSTILLMADLFTVASQMSALGLLDEQCYCLCHLGLKPNNILVCCPPSGSQSQAITGVLGWDAAIFAPRFMSCTPPFWLWAGIGIKEEDERLANLSPPTPELQEIKQLFEDAAGPTYHRFAYRPEYRLARRLLKFCLDGIDLSKDRSDVELLVFQWKELVSTEFVTANMGRLQIDPINTTRVDVS